MRLRLHEILEVEVLELTSDGACIVNIDGALLRVRSQLDSSPKPGDRIRVKVVALQPLKFQTIRGSKMGLNVEV